MKRLFAISFAIAMALSSAAHAEDLPSVTVPPARPLDPHKWGDASLTLVERYGYFDVAKPEVGKSGLMRASGFEARFVMPQEWGAYYRYLTGATRNNDGFDWSSKEFMMGMSRRLMHVGQSDVWGFRASARLDFGIGYASVGTNGACTGDLKPWSTSCVTLPTRGGPTNASGGALGLEARFSADVAYGLFFLGLDVGAAAFARMSTGDSSVSPPGLMYLPSGQLRLGIGFPFS